MSYKIKDKDLSLWLEVSNNAAGFGKLYNMVPRAERLSYTFDEWLHQGYSIVKIQIFKSKLIQVMYGKV